MKIKYISEWQTEFLNGPQRITLIREELAFNVPIFVPDYSDVTANQRIKALYKDLKIPQTSEKPAQE